MEVDLEQQVKVRITRLSCKNVSPPSLLDFSLPLLRNLKHIHLICIAQTAETLRLTSDKLLNTFRNLSAPDH